MAKWKEPKSVKIDLRTIDQPFGELDERTQKSLHKAKKRGWPIQRYERYSLEWHEIDPFWVANMKYRLDPTFTPPVKQVIYVVRNTIFETALEAKTAYPGKIVSKFKECK